MINKRVGIASIGIHLPSLALNVVELARLRKVDPDKYLIGLGCNTISICPEGIGVVDLAVEAARRALKRWSGNINDIGLLAVGTENSLDMSRPLSAFIAERLGLQGAVRSYEVKHACLGGTLALRQALEWKLAGMAPSKAALVIATDVSLYAPNDPGEPTQGAGAIAFIIDYPLIAEIEPASYAWSKPVFDFWRPIHEPFPFVDGETSINAYKEAAEACFSQLLTDTKITFKELLLSLAASCFHVPFPKMVKKAFMSLGNCNGLSDTESEQFYLSKVVPTIEWNVLSGNSYTASLWISVAKALAGLQEGEKITAFSYGSGCGAELLTLVAGPEAMAGEWANDIKQDLEQRDELTAQAYDNLRKRLV